MSDVVIQSDRLVRLIAGIHTLFATGKQPARRHYEVIFFVGGRMGMQVERNFHLIPTNEMFLLALQYANLRYPFEECLLVDQTPWESISYKAASRAGAYAEDAYSWDEEAGVYKAEEGDAFQMIEIPPLFERPQELVPPRIASWIDANLHQSTLPRI